ncbi:hypothetical protein FLAG1_08829, partial [Fusarium langsethiae]
WVRALIPSPATEDESTPTSVVFVPGTLFKTLFKSEKLNDTQEEPTICYVAKFHYMSHVRSVAAGNDYNNCSVTVSHRTGPLDAQSPAHVFVHLVSLQGINGLELSSIKERVAMTSLYSWSYMVIQPDSTNTRTQSRNLSIADNGISILPTYEVSESPHDGSGRENNQPDIAEVVKKRQTYGYTFIRHQTQTGEVSSAMFRGPLVPTKVPHPLRPNMRWQSNIGSDLKIQDPELGMVDLTYSTAWNLGKTLALGDQQFTVALSRIRSSMHKDVLDRTKPDAGRSSKPGSTTRDEVLASLGDISALPITGTGAAIRSASRRRWPSSADPDLDSKHNAVPSSRDYTILQDWLLNTVQLSDIPTQYLIPEITYPPKETIRFFHVDENWIDALVDGALSMVNHVVDKPEDDYVRSALKVRLNKYLHSPREDLGRCQQIPVYGFLFRSELIGQFSDITIAIISPAEPNGQRDPNDSRAESHTLIQRRFDPDIMLVLLDHELPELSKMQFTFRDRHDSFAIPTDLYLELTNKDMPQDETVDEHSREYIPTVTEKEAGEGGWRGGLASW